MAKINIPCLVGKTNKAGVTNWYWQPSATLKKAGYKQEKLGKDDIIAMRRAQDLNKEVAAWKLGADKKADIKPHVATGTIAQLITRYRAERVLGINPETREPWVKPKTAESYETGLKRIEAWAGTQPVSFVTAERVQVLRDTMLDPVDGIGHAPALVVLRTLRQLFKFAEGKGIIAKGSNPAANFELAAPKGRKQVWEREDEAAFIQAAYALNMPSMALAIELGIYSAQREDDLLHMTENQIHRLEIDLPELTERLSADDGHVYGWVFGQGKSNRETGMEIPLEPAILAKVQAALRINKARDRAATPPRLTSTVLIDDNTGLPWHLCYDGPQRKDKQGNELPRTPRPRAISGAKRAFFDAWKKVIAQAVKSTGRTRMNDLVWHDLRRTRVVRLRRRGMAKEMIASITGHSLNSIEMMLAVYGPIDPTITATAIVSALEPRARPQQNPSNIAASKR